MNIKKRFLIVCFLTSFFAVSNAFANDIEVKNVFNNALTVAKKQQRQKQFKKNYNCVIDNMGATVNLELGYLFDAKLKYLIITINQINDVWVKIYSINQNQFKQILYKNEAKNTFIKSRILDVNNDGLKDYLWFSYPNSGCCRRNMYEVYLLLPNKQFFKPYHFINPTFYPKEKAIRGLYYGYGAGLYKYQWTGLKIDTLMHINPNPRDNLHKTFVTFNYKTKQEIIIDSIPTEYQKIDDYDAFINQLN
jgi:hypothetical protein